MAAFSHFLNNLRLSSKVTLMTVCALVLLSSATFAGSRILMMANAREQGGERLDTNMRVAWAMLDKLGRERSVRDGALYAGEVKLNGNTEIVDAIRDLVGGTATIFQGEMRVTTNVKKDDGSRAVGLPLAAGKARDAVLTEGVPYRGEADILGKPYFTAYDPIRGADGKVIGVLYVGIPAGDYFAHANTVGWQGLGIAVLITALAAFLCMRAATLLFRPLEDVTATMKRLAEGDNDVVVKTIDHQDEIGNITRALNVFRETAIAKQTADREQASVVEQLSGGLSKLAAGDLTADIRKAFPTSYEGLRSNFNSALESLRELIGAASDSADSIRQGSHEIAQASEDLARRTEGNAASLEQSSAALVEIDSRLKTSADAATRTVARADQAISTVNGGRSIAGEAVQAMGRVSESAKDIDSVIEGLDKIAFQTRVLAMNAAVEAGRAGEAGRGFAVVADLVSALAMRSEEEAKLAREQLTLTQAGIVTAVEAVHKVDGAFADISSDVQQVHELLGGMAADNQAQSTAISQITVAVGTMNQSTQQNAAMVEETSAAARNLTGEVGKMTAQTARFTVEEGRRAAASPTPVRAPAPPRASMPKPAAKPAAKTAYVSPVKALPQSVPVAAGGGGDWDAF